MNIRTGPLAIGVTVLMATMVLLGCGGPDLSTDQLSWCAGHQAEVGRVALSRGLLDPGRAYSDWKTGDAGGYRTACKEAFDAR
ncbi:MAG: hypothetical protein LH650_11565 [Chloroflexi bacterium]|nr:hypothetical protein [Chloroflexota bacterium]